MSQEPGQPASGGERPAFTGRFPILTTKTPSGQGSGGRRPTFSAPAVGPAENLAPSPAPADGQGANPAASGEETDCTGSDTSRSSASGGAVGTAGAEDTGTPDTSGTAKVVGVAAPGAPAGAARSPGADIDAADGPLLGDTVGLRLNWERVQAGFVDDPGEAVSDAADLVEHTVQALVGALRQRQRTLRELAKPKVAGPDGGQDTEHLRRMMLRYRALFNQICRP